MTHEEHMFLSKFLFDTVINLKKTLGLPLDTWELQDYKQLAIERKYFYEKFSYLLIKDFHIEIEKNLPF